MRHWLFACLLAGCTDGKTLGGVGISAVVEVPSVPDGGRVSGSIGIETTTGPTIDSAEITKPGNLTLHIGEDSLVYAGPPVLIQLYTYGADGEMHGDIRSFETSYYLWDEEGNLSAEFRCYDEASSPTLVCENCAVDACESGGDEDSGS